MNYECQGFGGPCSPCNLDVAGLFFLQSVSGERFFVAGAGFSSS